MKKKITIQFPALHKVLSGFYSYLNQEQRSLQYYQALPSSASLETAELSCLWASLSTAPHKGRRNKKQRKECLALSLFSHLYDLPRNLQAGEDK